MPRPNLLKNRNSQFLVGEGMNYKSESECIILPFSRLLFSFPFFRSFLKIVFKSANRFHRLMSTQFINWIWWGCGSLPVHRGRTAILREKKAKKSIKSSKKSTFLQEKSTFLTQILNINEYFPMIIVNFLNLGIVSVYFYLIQRYI